MKTNLLNKLLTGGLAVMAMTIVLNLSQARAETFTWSGGGSAGVWNDAVNWGDAGVPGAGDTAVLTDNVTFTDLDGQSVGAIDGGSAYHLSLEGEGTFTVDNLGSQALIESSNFSTSNNLTINFNDPLSIISNREITGTSDTTFKGDSLAITTNDWGWKSGANVVMEVEDLDLSGSRIRANHYLPDMDGVTVDFGTLPIYPEHLDSASYAGLTNSHLQMDTSYSLFSRAKDNSENIELLSWNVGGTSVPAGTYDVNSPSYNGVDFGTIFQNDSGISFTVVPEPSTLVLLGLGGLLLMKRRAL